MKNVFIIFSTLALIIFSLFNCEKPEELISPECVISCPAENTEIFLGDTVTVSISPEDTDGKVMEVRLYIDSSIVALFFNFPYDYEWVTACEETGLRTIKAVVMDNDSLISESIISVILNERRGAGTVTDIDGNTYKTVKIGTQQWMAENLKTLHYTDGSEIIFVDTQNLCSSRKSEERILCYYSIIAGYISETYGAYYPWKAVVRGEQGSDENPSGIQGVCPAGWHMPSDSEWKQLEEYLGMSTLELDATGFRGTDQGAKLKDVCSGLFGSFNGITNETGFSAIPGGYKNNVKSSNSGLNANFWSATGSYDNGGYAWIRRLDDESNEIYRDTYSVFWYLNVRCLKD